MQQSSPLPCNPNPNRTPSQALTRWQWIMWHGSHLVLVACLSTESRCLTEHRWVCSLPELVSMVAAALATAVQSPCNPNPNRNPGPPQRPHGGGGSWHRSHQVLVACLPTEAHSHTKHRWVRGLLGLVIMVTAALATAVQSPCNPNPMIAPQRRTPSRPTVVADHGTDRIRCLWHASPLRPTPTPSKDGCVACLDWSSWSQQPSPPPCSHRATLTL